MKPCLICHASCHNEALSCAGCGEGSFGAAVDSGDAPPSDDGKAPAPSSPPPKAQANKGGKGKRGKGAASDAPPSDDAKADEE